MAPSSWPTAEVASAAAALGSGTDHRWSSPLRAWKTLAISGSRRLDGVKAVPRVQDVVGSTGGRGRVLGAKWKRLSIVRERIDVVCDLSACVILLRVISVRVVRGENG